MSKKKELKRLRERIARLEGEMADLRGRLTVAFIREPNPVKPWQPPNYPTTWPQITCTANPVDGKALTRVLNREIKMRGLSGIN